MDNRTLITALIVPACLALAACSQAPAPSDVQAKGGTEVKKEVPPPPPPAPIAAQTAFYEMYKPARTWAPDVQPLSLAGGDLPTMKQEGGKAPMWTAVFVSASRREARTFTYAVADGGGDIRKGVSAGGAQGWSGDTPQSKAFQNSDFQTNSDAAYQAALEKAGDWVKAHPDKKPALYLGNSSKFPTPVWLVLWGNTKNGYAAYVSATTGKVLGK
jgi:hypothetical protein